MPNFWGDFSGSSASKDLRLLSSHARTAYQAACNALTTSFLRVCSFSVPFHRTCNSRGPQRMPSSERSANHIRCEPLSLTQQYRKLNWSGKPPSEALHPIGVVFALYPCSCSSRLSRMSCKTTGEFDRRPTMIHLLPLRLAIPV
jgi:hypothetical protein